MAPALKSSRLTKSGSEFEKLLSIMKRLLGPNGCPWDKKQTHSSLKKYAIEETYELIDAIESGNNDSIIEELGDLLLQVVFHSVLAEKRKVFNINDVIKGISDKLVERHPHVFGTMKLKTADDVISNWEKIKQQNNLKKKQKGIFSGIPSSLPALLTTYRIIERAGKQSELIRLIKKISSKLSAEELSSVIFYAAILLSVKKQNPEEILRRKNKKFMKKLEKEISNNGGKNENRSKKIK